ncbi:LuxR C-terminal-related transcriptional regulator [Mycobacterium sp. AT1]|uniref:LuxR C-terminal-related transcriptional regulator n=1 Tax=Mycobacterium sp. AT1 TaxID=1961706 RepID=UPI001E29AFE4|nr:LuxR C-terminal-related transcriptional regulator [Mycobacterium sp. AT1]
MTLGEESGQLGISLATKLVAPPLRSGLIDRTVLLDALCVTPHRKLTLLSAPAGWGKTTLMAQWTRSTTQTFAWLTLDATDNDPSRFWSCTIAALQKATPGLGARALEMLRMGADTLQVVLPLLLNELAAADRNLVLILDEYNAVGNPVVHEQVAFVIDRMPTTLRLVIATRSDPVLPLARLRANGDLLEVRTGDLRFRAAEAELLLTDVLGLNLSPAEVEMLFDRTEGWAAGLYLAALSLGGQSDGAAFLRTFAGDNRHIVDYLIAEVLDGQPPTLRSFLLRTSVLRRLSGELCDAVLQSTGSSAILAEIEKNNLFLTSLDESRHWYRYHQLFAELLRTHLQYVEPEMIPVLHERAASWFTARGFADDAVYHLAAAGDTASLTDFIATQAVTEVNRGRLSTVSGWIDLLPYDVALSDPRLGVARAWIALDSGHLDTAGSWIEAAEACLSSDSSDHEVVRDQFEVVRAVYEFKIGRVDNALPRARLAIADGVSAPRFGPTLGRPRAYCLHGSALYFSGAAPEARIAYQQALQLAEELGDHRARVYALGYLAVIAAEDEKLEDAEDLVHRATGESQNFTPGERSMGVMASLLATAMISESRGHGSRARQAADMAVDAALQGGGGVLEVAKALVVRAGILERCGDSAGAAAARTEAAAALNNVEDASIVRRLLGPSPRSELAESATEPGERLTSKELEVVRLLATRLSRREIGDRLYVSINTVKTHQRAVYRKFGVDTRAEAVRRAKELGLL